MTETVSPVGPLHRSIRLVIGDGWLARHKDLPDINHDWAVRGQGVGPCRVPTLY